MLLLWPTGRRGSCLAGRAALPKSKEPPPTPRRTTTATPPPSPPMSAPVGRSRGEINIVDDTRVPPPPPPPLLASVPGDMLTAEAALKLLFLPLWLFFLPLPAPPVNMSNPPEYVRATPPLPIDSALPLLLLL